MSAETLVVTRESIAARRQVDFERWQRYIRHEVVASPEVMRSGEAPYRQACEVLGIDHDDIKQRAAELIARHDFAPRSEWQGEYEDNARTILFELLTESGHLSTVEFRDTPEAVNQKTLERWLNGMQPDLPEQELKRRFNEICEELVIQEVQAKVQQGELPPDTQIATESTYITGMSDKEAARLGYNYQNKKGMVRSTGFVFHDDGTVTRKVEQISYSNSSAHESILRRHQEGIATLRTDEADVDLLGSPLIFSLTDMQEGVVGIQRRIDAFAGSDIRFGITPDETTPSYERLREVSAERESHVEQFVTQLANWEQVLDEQLKAGAITQPEHDKLYMKEVRSIIRAICVLQPEYTRDALGEDVVAAYQKANELMMAGDDSAAASAIESVAHLENELMACGMYEEKPNPNSPQNNNDKTLRNKLRDIKENWQWIDGKCRVEKCPNSKKRTKVGPCHVCVGCQSYFDNGFKLADINKLYTAAERRQRKLPAVANTEQIKAVSEADIKLRFEEQMGIGTATVYAYNGDMLVAEGDEAIKLKRRSMSSIG